MEASVSHACFRFYAELNDHLPCDRQYQTLEKTFYVSGAVKDMIESFGVPHTEVELILINGESADFSSLVRDGDRVAAYPMFESLDITPELRVRTRPLRDPKFVLDVHLGRLAAYLRMLGFDAKYDHAATDPELAGISSAEQRILLTRDRGLLKRSAVTRGYWVRQTGGRQQAAEVVAHFDLGRSFLPFTRCMVCNAVLREATKEEVRPVLPVRAAAMHEEFLRCPSCARVFWKGSHYRRMQSWIGELARLV